MKKSGKAFKKQRNLEIKLKKLNQDREAKIKDYQDHINKLKSMDPNKGIMLYQNGTFLRWSTPALELEIYNSLKNQLEQS